MFHIGEDGEPRPCKAQKGNCPLGPANEHSTTKEGARKFFEEKNAEALFATLSKPYAPIAKESFVIKDLKMESVDREAFALDDNGKAYGLKLKPGLYAIADPELFLQDEDDTAASSPTWERWAWAAKVATSTEQEIVDPNKKRIEPGKLFAAKVNGYTVSVIGTSAGSGEFASDNGEFSHSRSGLLAAVPLALLEKMNHDFHLQPATIVNIESDSVAVFSESSENIHFGNAATIHTGYPEDDDDYDYED